MNKKPLRSFGQWQLVKPLGSGAFGEVHYWKNYETGCEIATKRLKANPKLKADEISVLHKRWLQEYGWIENLRTEFIVGAATLNDLSFLNYINEQNHAEPPLPVIVMEYCNGGALRETLNKKHNMNGLSEYEVRNILFSLLRATDYLHQECRIEHRDIKPENVVLHIRGNKTTYKLTDFGYAKEIPESTIAQSVVGTRNYVAPEVIDSGVYTKSVDYWSIGILAYEIICGIQPFIPHQTFINRIRAIKKKPKQCIAIVQNINDLALEDFEFISDILPQNHLSVILLSKMEDWLRMALDTNYKTRGCNNNNELKFYSDFDVIRQKNVVTVFSLKTFKKYYYDIESYGNLSEFYNKICEDNQLSTTEIFFVFPPLHPKTPVQTPADFFVSEWCDIANTENPPVMLFVTEYRIQNDYEIEIERHFPVSKIIKKCMNMRAETENLENTIWLLEQFERDVHFVLSECQHSVECYLTGLQRFIIETEHAVCTYTYVETLVQRTLQLCGSVKHSNVVLSEYLQIQRGEAAKLPEETAQMFDKQCQELLKVIVPKLRGIHKEILQKCRQLTKHQIYEKYSKNDIFQLLKYRKFLSFGHPTAAERLERTQEAFEISIREFIKFTNCMEMKNLRASFREQVEKFDSLRQAVFNENKKICQLEEELENYTRSLIRNIIQDKLSVSMNSLHIDGPSLKNSPPNNHSPLNCFEMDAKTLIDECQILCNAMEMSLEINK